MTEKKNRKLKERYEVMGTVRVNKGSRGHRELDKAREKLRLLGNSLGITTSPSGNQIAIHIHTNDPEKVQKIISALCRKDSQPEFELTDMQTQLEKGGG